MFQNNQHYIHPGHQVVQDERLRWIEMVSRFMDSQFRLPGTNFRFGLDPILSFIPFGGSAASFAVSAGLLVTMFKYGVSRKVLIMMLGNLVLDALIGSIPVIGTLFDFVYKANQRNVSLLRKHYQAGKYQGSGSGLLATIIIVLFLLLVLIIYGTWQLMQYLIGLVW
ncbi:DUF4112 domain-containing protein [Adhaeribacter rhizoryzae]|uniref:DUF4112 domain-containing protein n=1 Tax=Adhaeribacter rhizoryzae TaxID=2607907 RepID=A0A5M6CZU1_9BACT|nr:DUF4112 domain-containing protein [Adhaeribacter rhizoryzae]KAA5539552.1 DUF4112 domain-containing protein [Adhaeribacter rhizoryzae]